MGYHNNLDHLNQPLIILCIITNYNNKKQLQHEKNGVNCVSNDYTLQFEQYLTAVDNWQVPGYTIYNVYNTYI